VSSLEASKDTHLCARAVGKTPVGPWVAEQVNGQVKLCEIYTQCTLTHKHTHAHTHTQTQTHIHLSVKHWQGPELLSKYTGKGTKTQAPPFFSHSLSLSHTCTHIHLSANHLQDPELLNKYPGKRANTHSSSFFSFSHSLILFPSVTQTR
jgi:hypothetical protein